MTPKIYAPNLHCFAFQLAEENPDHLWDYYEKTIKPNFSLSPELERQTISPGEKAYLNKNSPTEVFQELQGTLKNYPIPITGLVCPLLLYDSYGLALNLRIPEKNQNNQPTELVDLNIFAEFNPNQIFRPEKFNSDLGQTILLTAWLQSPEKEQREHWQTIGNQILNEFLGDENVPGLYQSGQLFGNPIYEYGSPQKANKNGKIDHYLVWLFIDETADRYLGDCYLDFIDLWFYRQKITTTYQYSRLEFEKIKEQYHKIKKNVETIHQNLPDFATTSQLSDQNLTDLKQKLKVLPKLDLDYINDLMIFKNRALAQEINTHNYQVKLHRILTQTHPEDLTVLSVFNEKIAVMLHHQIVADLGYFDQGSRLVEKAINSIRGIVEIDQAERDRQRQQDEKDRERDEQERDRQRQQQNEELQDTIQAIGVGVAAGAIVASTSGLITQPWQLPHRDRFWLPPHPFIIALLASVICAVGGWYLAKISIEKWRSNQNLNKTNSTEEKKPGF